MKQYTHIRIMATAALAMSIGLIPLSSALALPQSAASAPDASQTSNERDQPSDGIIVTLTDKAEREILSLLGETDVNAIDTLSIDDAKGDRAVNDGGNGGDNSDSSDAAAIELLDSSSAYRELEDAGMEVTQQVATTGEDIALEVQPADGVSDQEALEAALELDSVKSAQPNYVYNLIEPVADEPLATAASPAMATLATDGDAGAAETAEAATDGLPNDPWASISNPDEAPNQYYLYSSHFTEAWNMVKTNKTVTVAVLDSGVELDHSDLKDNLLTPLAWDSYYDQALTGTGDYVGHGTHVAGIIAGVANNRSGIAGGSYNAKILPVKVFSNSATRPQSNTTALISAYKYILTLVNSTAVEDLHVINLSLGYYGSDSNDRLLQQTIRDARDNYRIATVCAAGNGNKVDTAYTENIYPADFEECIAVTALTATGSNVVFSDYNKAKDISAPGASIWSTYTRETTLGDVNYGKYTRLTGTSMASPMVSAACALLFAERPNATVDQVCDALYTTAEPVVDAENDRTQTSGSHGALNVAAALVELDAAVEKPLSFTDVAKGDWFYDAVMGAANRKIMNGYPTGDFRPNKALTREQAAVVLYNYLGEGDTSSPRAPHTDVLDDYYTPAVNWAVAKGYMKGYGDTNVFGVGQPLTRQELAGIFANIVASKEDLQNIDASVLQGMTDYRDSSDWAVPALAWCVTNGVINGKGQADGTRQLQPKASCSRAEMAGIMMNSIGQGLI